MNATCTAVLEITVRSPSESGWLTARDSDSDRCARPIRVVGDFGSAAECVEPAVAIECVTGARRPRQEDDAAGDVPSRPVGARRDRCRHRAAVTGRLEGMQPAEAVEDVTGMAVVARHEDDVTGDVPTRSVRRDSKAGHSGRPRTADAEGM